MDGWMEGVPVNGSGREEWQGGGGWKKYKSETGNGEIFSWKEPTGGQRAFKSLLDMKMC